jgi:type IV pilus assembly protein PilE
MIQRARAAAGFTLIELMIVVAVVAILAAIAVPAYQEHIVKTRRATGAGCMMEMAQFMERFYTTNMRYDRTAGGAAVALPATQCVTETAEWYTIQLRDGATNATAYVIEAVPQGSQATKDTKCATIAVDQTGQKSESGSASSANDCF